LNIPVPLNHVTSRSGRRDDIYLGEEDRHGFIQTLAEACQKTGWQVRLGTISSSN